jgi:hypothetical protein
VTKIIPDDVMRKIAKKAGVSDDRFDRMCLHVRHGVVEASRAWEKETNDPDRVAIQKRLSKLETAACELAAAINGLDSPAETMIEAAFEDYKIDKIEAPYDLAHVHDDEPLEDMAQIKWPVTLREYRESTAIFAKIARNALRFSRHKNTKQGGNPSGTHRPSLLLLVRWLLLAIEGEGRGKMSYDRAGEGGTLAEVLDPLREHAPAGLIPDPLPWRALETLVTRARSGTSQNPQK